MLSRLFLLQHALPVLMTLTAATLPQLVPQPPPVLQLPAIPLGSPQTDDAARLAAPMQFPWVWNYVGGSPWPSYGYSLLAHESGTSTVHVNFR